MQEMTKMEKIVGLCKRRGFVYQGSEIYGGLAGTWDYGPLGVALKNNIKKLWWERFVLGREDVYGLDAAIIMNPAAWVASGHAQGFADPAVQCKKCGAYWRTDHVIASQLVEEGNYLCPLGSCRTALGTEEELNKQSKSFNMMFTTSVGAGEESAIKTYLRPETAGGIFVNYKNVLDSMHPKLPFGIAQIGKAFRNEIAPRDFLFRAREFEQMEIEYFINPKTWETTFEEWREEMHGWIKAIGLPVSMVHELEVPKEDLAHYSRRTIDFEFDYPFGRSELYGMAYRTDFDLASHAQASGVDLTYFDEATGERFLPHVIEPSLGVDRTALALLYASYTEDSMNEDSRVFLKLSPRLAPVTVAVFPLLRNKTELVARAREIYALLRQAQVGAVVFDDNGNVGKRYRRQDEIGTPWCVTVDFDTLGEKPEARDTVTLRDRDTGKQERVNINELTDILESKLV